MTVKNDTNFSMRGDLEVIRRDAATGNIISDWEKKNVITFDGPLKVLQLLAPNAAFGADIQLESQIKSMRFGTSNATPQRTDTDLLNEALVVGVPVRVELLDANRLVGQNTVEFIATLDSGDGNGVTYREAGLFTRGDDDDPQVTANSVMFSRQVFPDQEKTAAVVLEFRWRITITV